MKTIKPGYINTFVLLHILILKTVAQTYVVGKVVDSTSKEPIAFASVFIESGHNGTVTNESGGFVLSIDSLPSRINFYSIGYNKKSFFLNKSDTQLNVYLARANYRLKEIVIKAGEAEMLMAASYKKMRAGQNESIRVKSFFRLLTITNGKYSELIESYFNSYLMNSGMRSWEFEQGRYAIVNDSAKNESIASLDLSSIYRYTDLTNFYSDGDFPLFPFFSKCRKYFNFIITGRYTDEGSEIVRIKFIPKDKTYNLYSGTVDINASTFDLVKIDVNMEKMNSPIIHPLNRSDRIENFDVNIVMLFRSVYNRNFPTSMKFIVSYDYRSSTLSTTSHVQTQSTLVNYNFQNTIPANGIPSDFDLEDYSAIKYNLYLPEFWENNNALLSTQLEDSIRAAFENNQSFGKAFNTKNDTLLVIKDGYRILDGSPINLHQLVKPIASYFPDSLFILRQFNVKKGYDDTVAGITSEIYFVYTCFHDSIYFRIMPLYDYKYSFINREFESDTVLASLFQNYFRLTQVFAKRLEYELKQFKNPCSKKKEILKTYFNSQLKFEMTKDKMLKEIWVDGLLDKWDEYINEQMLRYQ